MAQAALEAGLAFTNAILGATHAMSHQVGGMLDLPHGVVNGVLLPHVIRFNGAELPERFVPIAQAHGPGRGGRAAGRGRRAGGRARCARSATRSACPAGSARSGCGAEDLPRLSELTLSDACLSTNPRQTSVERRRGDVPGGAVSAAAHVGRPRDAAQARGRRSAPDLDALTGLRSGKPHYYPEYRDRPPSGCGG